MILLGRFVSAENVCYVLHFNIHGNVFRFKKKHSPVFLIRSYCVIVCVKLILMYICACRRNSYLVASEYFRQKQMHENLNMYSLQTVAYSSFILW